MRLGAMIHAATQFGNDCRPFHEAVGMICTAGFDSISFLSRPGGYVLNDPSDQPPQALIDIVRSNPQAIRRVADDAGLELVHFHAGGFQVESDEATRQSIEQMKPVVDAALALGLRFISSGQYYRLDWPDEATKRPYQERMAYALNAVGDYIGGADLMVGIDVHCYAAVETVPDAEYLIDRLTTPKAGLCLNMGHLRTANQPGWELVTRHPERIALAAWKDHIVTPGSKEICSVRLGRGTTPFDKYKTAFQSVKSPAHHIHSFEHEPYDTQQQALAESVHYWRRLWA